MALLDELAFQGYPQMGRRKAMPNRDVEMNQGLLRGASYYPYDLLGSPIDLINMALKPMGLGSQKPVMGSDYLQSLAQQYGLSQQPTGSNAENVARLAMSAMNPATGARAVGRVVEPTMQALGPKAYGLLEDYMVKSGGMIPLTAYHGSPYRFDKFDPTKIGTGQGAQLRGEGMYFAEDLAIASPYSKIEPSGMAATPNRQLFGKDVDPLTPEYKVSQLVDEMGVSKAKKFISDWAKDPLPDQVGYVDNLQSIISNVAKKSDAKNLGASNMYKVDIPDEQIPNMLDWDKPLKEQPQFIQSVALANSKAAIKEFKRQNSNNLNVNKLENIYDLTGADFMSALGGKGKAEKILKENGVYGIKYAETPTLSKTESGEKFIDRNGEGTSNYVVFDPTDVKILERNKKAIEGLLD